MVVLIYAALCVALILLMLGIEAGLRYVEIRDGVRPTPAEVFYRRVIAVLIGIAIYIVALLYMVFSGENPVSILGF